uniref:Gustatory receptor n=1 Tax=Tetranychus urticae TaxID=32264 RepID=T1KJG3_TETUR
MKKVRWQKAIMVNLNFAKNVFIKTVLFIVGLPNEDDHGEETIAAFNQWCRLSRLFGSTINGYKRYSSATPNRISSFNRKNFLIRFCNIISMIRLLVLLLYENETVSIFAGDPLFRSKHRVLAMSIVFIALVIGFFSREIFLSLEAKSNTEIYFCFECFLQSNDFNHLNLQMTPSRAITHRYIVHFFSIFWTRFMCFVIPFLTILLNTTIIVNPFFYQIPSYAIFSIFWTIPFTFAFVYNIVGFASISGYVIMSGLYYLNRLKSICSIAVHTTNKSREIEDEFVTSLILRFIGHSNDVEHFLNVLSFLILYYILAISFLADLLIFAGFARVHSDIIANMCSFLGVFIMGLLAMACYTEGSFLTKLHLLYEKLHLISESRLKMKTKMKILEVMDRIIGPYNGVKAGDLATISKYFFVIFLLENASTLMLITVNTRSFLE